VCLRSDPDKKFQMRSRERIGTVKNVRASGAGSGTLELSSVIFLLYKDKRVGQSVSCSVLQQQSNP